MSDNDNKRYYWLKLKKDFFQQHKMKALKALPNGRLYALIYLELLAESTSHEGELRFSKMLPYDTVTLAAVIDEDKDNLEKAIETFVAFELVEILEDQTIFMRDIQTMIGSETGQTIRKREARVVKNTNQLPSFNQNFTLESRVKSIEYRDKSIDIDKYYIIINKYKEAGISDDEIQEILNIIPTNLIIEKPEDVFILARDTYHDDRISNKTGYLVTSIIQNNYGYKNKRKE